MLHNNKVIKYSLVVDESYVKWLGNQPNTALQGYERPLIAGVTYGRFLFRKVSHYELSILISLCLLPSHPWDTTDMCL